MPILTPQYDPNIDRYPGNEQAIQVAGLVANTLQGKRALGQQDRALDMREAALAADIAQTKERLGLFQQEVDLRKQAMAQETEFAQGAAQAASFGLDAMRGGDKQNFIGPMLPGMSADPETDLEIDTAQRQAALIKNERARALYLAEVGETIKGRKVQRQSELALNQMSRSIRGMASMPGMEPFVQRIQQVGEMLDASVNLPAAERSRVVGEAMDRIAEIEKSAEAQVRLQAVQADAVTFFQGLAAKMPEGSPQRAALAVATMQAQGMDSEDGIRSLMAEAFKQSIGFVEPIPTEIRGRQVGLSPKEFSDRDVALQGIEQRRDAVGARAGAAGSRTGGASAVRQSDLTERMGLYIENGLDIEAAALRAKQDLGLASIDGTIDGLSDQAREEAIRRLRSAVKGGSGERLSAIMGHYGLSGPVDPSALGIEIVQPEPATEPGGQPAAQGQGPAAGADQVQLPVPPTLVNRMMNNGLSPEEAADVIVDSIVGVATTALKLQSMPKAKVNEMLESVYGKAVRARNYASRLFIALALKATGKPEKKEQE